MANKTWIGTDGDYATAGNWSPSGVPTAGDDVVIPVGSGDITTGLDQSAVALDSFSVVAGYTGLPGTAAAYLQITTDVFNFAGQGTAYIDLGASTCTPNIRNTATPSTGLHGLYLKCTAVPVLNVIRGDVGVAAIFGETSTLTTGRSVGDSANVTIGAGVTLDSWYQTAGESTVQCATTDITVWGGTLTIPGEGAHTLVTVNGGEVYPETSGTITDLVSNGGETDFTGSGESREVTNLTQNPGGTVIYDPNVVNVVNRLAPNGPVRIDAQLAT